MRKIIGLLIAFIALFSPSVIFAQNTGPVICIDAGHGGNDNGASYGSLLEKDETLQIAQDLQQKLLVNNYQVIMTRVDDTGLTNSQRADICNGNNTNKLVGQVLVSIHLNASSNHSLDYTQGLYGKKIKDYDFTKTINTAMGQLPDTTGNKGITNFADGMLLKSKMPSTIAETVFITSDTEYARLTDTINPGYRQREIADYLYKGISAWFSR
ncbi:N-acetylmuramoyl-L-alanine amidase [Candidatus Gottesmanbacteria bacterium]|nr:N-acetylmuramoyl-L-alanine amidase [Candidatus Gottesmanbacteria bacterium]